MKRLLIVDDAAIMRKLIADAAIESGWEVVGEASNGRDALALYRQLSPDLMTLDLVMPLMDGLETLKEVRSLDPHAQVVIVTAIDQKDTLMETIRLGALDFLVKPIRPDRIQSVLAKVARRNARSEHTSE